MNFFRREIHRSHGELSAPNLRHCINYHLATSDAKRTHSLPAPLSKRKKTYGKSVVAENKWTSRDNELRITVVVVVETRGNPSPPHLAAEEESSQGGNNPAVGGVEGVGSGSGS